MSYYGRIVKGNIYLYGCPRGKDLQVVVGILCVVLIGFCWV